MKIKLTATVVLTGGAIIFGSTTAFAGDNNEYLTGSPTSYHSPTTKPCPSKSPTYTHSPTTSPTESPTSSTGSPSSSTTNTPRPTYSVTGGTTVGNSPTSKANRITNETGIVGFRCMSGDGQEA